jgi:hypothetical protein
MPLNIFKLFSGEGFTYPASGPKKEKEKKKKEIISKFLSPSHAIDQKIWVRQRTGYLRLPPMASTTIGFGGRGEVSSLSELGSH